MIEGTVFIGAAIIAATQAIKLLVPQINGAITIGIAVVLGVVVALLDTDIGVADLTVAQGVMAGLASAGVVTVARNVQGPSE